MAHIYCIHGFLGLPSDWNFLEKDHSSHEFHKINLSAGYQPEKGFEGFSAHLNSLINPNETNILLGYSLGGRLALHAIKDHPKVWKAAMLVSVNPGLPSEEMQADRMLKDGVWAIRFLAENWSSVLNKWNQQPVFLHSKNIDRRMDDFNRDVLADMLTYWSLGRQQDLRQTIKNLPLPIYWVSGALDSYFIHLQDSILLDHSSSCKITIPEAGHRVPWDQPAAFSELFGSFLTTLKIY
jgi:2-succinyl-6-hydroxy-2,4-cyclohexadiene-1-carboxylate synthase